jgi:plasmid maintenance system antidote protein VapI
MPPRHTPVRCYSGNFLEPGGVTQAEAAKRIGVLFQRLNAIGRGRRVVSTDTAIRLEALTLMEAAFLASATE